MREIVVLVILFWSAQVYAVSFDDIILWNYQMPAPSDHSFSLEPIDISKPRLNILFLHSDPYRISGLHWNYAAIKYGLGRWGIFGQVRLYGLDDLYTKNSISLGGVVKPRNNVALSLSISRDREEFIGLAEYNRYDLDAKLAVMVGGLIGGIDVDRINLKAPYESRGITNPEPMIYGSLAFDKDFRLSIAARRQNTNKVRLLFRQDVKIVQGIDLQLGYISNPNVFNWGLDLSWKSFTFDFAYFAMSRLNDTIALGLSISL